MSQSISLTATYFASDDQRFHRPGRFPPRSLRNRLKSEEIAQWVARRVASDALVIE